MSVLSDLMSEAHQEHDPEEKRCGHCRKPLCFWPMAFRGDEFCCVDCTKYTHDWQQLDGPAGEDGGLHACTRCGAFEGATTTDCPGVPEAEWGTDFGWDQIYKAGGGVLSAYNAETPTSWFYPGGINYRGGQWRTNETHTSVLMARYYEWGDRVE